MSSTTKTKTKSSTTKTKTTPDPPGRRSVPPPRTSSRAPAPAGRALLVRCPGETRDADELVTVARLGRPWGVRGAITVRLHNSDSDLAWVDDVVWLSGEDLPPTAVEVDRWEDKSGKLLIHLAGITSPQAAGSLTHLEIHVPADWLPEAGEDEHYVHQLIGMKVVDEARGGLGKIVHVFATGAHDVWVVKGDGGEELIPAVKDFVLDIDAEAGVARVRWSMD